MKTMPHVCTIEKPSSRSCLPTLSPNATFWQRHCRILRKYMLVSDRDSRIIEYFRTTTGLMSEKRRQVESKYYYMIHPFSDFNYVREAVMTLVFLSWFVLIPYYFSFKRNHALQLNMPNICSSIANIVCIGDIVSRFFTGYVDSKQKTIVLDQKKVSRYYILGPYFFCDVISSLPSDFVGYALKKPSPYVHYWHYLRLLKLVRFKTFSKCFDRTSVFIRWNKIISLVVRYSMIVGLIVHWVACLNYFVPHVRSAIQKKHHMFSWVWVISKRPVSVKYAISVFRTTGFVLGASSTQPDAFRTIAQKVKLGTKSPLPEEISPLVEESANLQYKIFNGPSEELLLDTFNIVLGKISTSAFAVIIISRIFERYTLETKYQAIMNQLEEFMKNKKLPLAMRDRLVQYYEHRYQNKYFKEEVITGILSENSRKEVNINVCRQLVYMVNIFSDLPPNILSDVLSHLKAEVYLPNDIIIKAGTSGDCMYFLASGTVAVYTPSGREVCHSQDGAYFGEIALISKNTKRTTDIIAIEVCEVYRSDKKAFRSCFKYDRYGVFEKMQQVAEQRLQKTALSEETYKLELFQKAYTEKM